MRRKKIRIILTKLGRVQQSCRWRWGDGEVKREERKCTECDSGEVEDVKHFLMICEVLNTEREKLITKMKKIVTGLDEVE